MLRKFMTVTVDIMPEGMNFSCWISTEPSWLLEIPKFPNHYEREGDDCTWHIHANMELTIKMVNMVAEYADKICLEGRQADQRRKVVNR